MRSRRFLTRLGLVLTAIFWLAGQCLAQSQTYAQSANQETRKSAFQRRQEANQRLRALLGEQPPKTSAEALMTPLKGAFLAPHLVGQPTPMGINPNVNIDLPNWANSPSIRKFVNSLPGLAINPAPDDPSVNQLGQYIPIAVPDTLTYPGSDYYEIALVQYREQMHSDLPAVVGSKTDPLATGGTLLRGYVQMNGGDPIPHYLGPVILAQKGRPVRIKFTNMLPTGPDGNLFLPVDTTIMGAGMGPLAMPGMPGMMESYTQNRGTLHLHGGLTPWISDGTPHQWTTPAMEMTSYPKGVATTNVPDMPDPGPGAMTFYYTNEQSARLMFYHDHAYGITRLNVYAGEAAGYLITDPVEDDLISGNDSTGGNPLHTQILPDMAFAGPLYRYGIPLVIQDKTFVNDPGTPAGPGFPTATYAPTAETAVVDPLWYTHVPKSAGGDLWIGHEYLPNENIYNATGFNDMGRWDYGPWILPPMLVMNDTLPSPSAIPEAFMDTMVVNGTAYPYIELPPTAVRFRILNACNDRMLNLQLYQADPLHPTEVRMVDASPTQGFPASWPKDGRDGGVPDPALRGPNMIQIGNESGILAKVAEIPPQPVDFDYNRRSVTFGAVTSKSLFMPPAVRADVIVDLSSYKDGDTLILYNDSPAPVPLYDTRYDYFTDDPDQTAIGGAPSTPEGYGPNTRTVMQIRIKGNNPSSFSFSLPNLRTALPKAFAVGQDPILVPAKPYNDAYNANYPDIYAGVADYTLNVSGTAQGVQKIVTELPGIGYMTPPTVKIAGGGGSGATATATLNGVTGVTLVTAGTGYTTPPNVTITGGGGTGAAAATTISGGVVTSVVVTNPGSNYTLVPTVAIAGGGGTGATAQATITLGSVGSIILKTAGAGYTKAPYVYLTGGGGTGAAAIATLPSSMVLDGKNLVEGMDMEYGRMNAVLGSTPNPLTPTVGAGPVVGMAHYIDPPTEILDPNQTKLWRLMHLGVDSHAMHFHLFEVQVINRVDWTNTLKPPYEGEIGWKETIRTNPFEDIIIALRPTASKMQLPFGIPDSIRLLDPTMPPGPGMFAPVAPPPGLPAVAQITNVMTNFGWEYVWHCHLLGHEENDMMRPVVFNAPHVLPTASTLGVVGTLTECDLTWNDPTPFDYTTGLPVSTLGNPANEVGYRIERAPAAVGMAFTTIATPLANATSYIDYAVAPGQLYRYRIVSWNAAGSVTSNTVLVRTGPVPPAAPTALAASLQAGPQIRLAWRDNATNETGFEVERADNGGPFVKIASPGPFTNTGLTNWTDTGVAIGNTYMYQVRAVNGPVASPYSNKVTMTIVPAPAAPSGLTATAAKVAGNSTQDRVTLTWVDNSNNETGFTIMRATNPAFTGAVSVNVAANTTTFAQNVTRLGTYYYQIMATNTGGSSAWSNTATVIAP